MTKTTFAVGGAAVIGFLAFPALAGSLSQPVQEAPVLAPAMTAAPSANWTGGYVGAQLGYGDASAGAVNGKGAAYGVHAGYDWDLGSWVLGAGVDWDKTNIDFGGGPDNLDSIARLKLRAGVDLGRTLAYATAGGAHAKATVGGTSHSDNGWYAGLGLDYALSDQWTVGGEVLTNRFDNFAGTGTDIHATTAAVNVGFRF